MIPYEQRQLDRLRAEAVARFEKANPGVEPMVLTRLDPETLFIEVSVHPRGPREV